ncbi:hypothetical protein [Streptomyces sp. NPDC001205]
MIRIVTRKRLALLEADTHAAFERARQTSEAAAKASGRHARELSAAVDRAEATTEEVSVRLSGAVSELAAQQEQLRLTHLELHRLRAELERGPADGETLTVLLHYGEPHTIYRSREDAHADTANHGVAADGWVPCDERPPSAFMWRCEAFVYDAVSNGFRRAFPPAAVPVRGAA